jgi:hypothetical protein
MRLAMSSCSTAVLAIWVADTTLTGWIRCDLLKIPLHRLCRDTHCRLLFERKSGVVEGLPMNNAELRKGFVHARRLIFIGKWHLVKPFRGLGKEFFPVQSLRLGWRLWRLPAAKSWPM